MTGTYVRHDRFVRRVKTARARKNISSHGATFQVIKHHKHTHRYPS